MIVGDEGSVLVTQNGGETWSAPHGVELKETEWIVAAAFAADGRSGVIVGDEGSVLVTQNGGETWSAPHGVELKETEQIVEAAFAADGRSGVIGGSEGSVFITRDGGKTWSAPHGVELKATEWIVAAAFAADGRSGVIGGNEGSVFVMQDGGKTWSAPHGVELRETGRIVAAAFAADGRSGVIGGNEGSVFVTRDGGKTWNSTERDDRGASFKYVVSATPDGREHLAADADGGVHLLKPYPEIAQWADRSLAEMRRSVEGDDILRESAIGKDILAFLRDPTNSGGALADGGDSKPSSGPNVVSRYVDDLTVMRIVTLIVLFFLVQVLVRLYQYSLRIAMFWDSRADAVLLARSFSKCRAEAFDDLVAALAPDAYDFRPPPKSGHETLATLGGRLRPQRGARDS